MDYEITPEPSDEERRAILAALAAEESERPALSRWGRKLLPCRDDGAADATDETPASGGPHA